MVNINIILTDLAYLSSDEFIHPLPLNVGYVGAYLKQELKNIHIKIIKDPKELYKVLDNAKEYHVIAFSNYDWNMNLNSKFLRLVKKKNPHIITVMGGPNIDCNSENDLKDFFLSNPGLDFYILGEGEYKFKKLIQSLIENEMIPDKIWANISKSIISFCGDKNILLRGSGEDIDSCDLNTIPSPYLTGLMDNFLDNPKLVPIIETSRGCPFNCAYCYWGSAINSRIRQFPLDTVLKEIEYISQKTKNPMKQLYIADANFGIFKRDVEIAQTLRETNIRTGFPRNIYVYFSKFTDEKIFRIAELLKGLTDISMSKQTLNEEVLKIIGRMNMPDEKYNLLHNKIKEVGMNPYCELIYGLPGESLESFLDGLEKIAQAGIKPVLYPLLLIKGTRINSRYFRKKYKIKSAFRIIPRYTGSYGTINSVEYEELAISNSKFSKDDFLKIRLIHFFHYMFSEKIFIELVKYLRDNKLNIVSFIRFLINDRSKWPNYFESVVSGFEIDTRNELIEKDLKFEFSKEEIDGIKSRGLALNIFYFCKLVVNKEYIEEFKQYLFNALKRYFARNSILNINRELSVINDICFDKIPNFPEIKPLKIKKYNYDVESWLNDEKRGISSYRSKKTFTYKLEFDKDLISLFNIQNSKYNNLELALYWFRMNFMGNRYLAYTYKRSMEEALIAHTNKTWAKTGCADAETSGKEQIYDR